MDPRSNIQTASFLINNDGALISLIKDGEKEHLRCASVLKPLLFWIGAELPAFQHAPSHWQALGEAAVVNSANEPTVELWNTCGGNELIKAIAEECGVAFIPESGGERAFGRVLITAKKTAYAYAALAGCHSINSEQVLAWMRRVPEDQTFGVRDTVSSRLGTDPTETAVKCGWFSDEDRIRTHAVTITRCVHGIVGTVALTALVMDATSREEYAGHKEAEGVLDLHERHAGAVVREATAAAIEMLELPLG